MSMAGERIGKRRKIGLQILVAIVTFGLNDVWASKGAPEPTGV